MSARLKQELGYGPLRNYLYHVSTSKAVLDCGHYKYVGNYAPARRVRCPKCRDGEPRDVSQKEMDYQLRMIRIMTLPLPDPEKTAELIQEFGRGYKTLVEQGDVLVDHGWNLSVVATARAVEAGTVRHADPKDPFSPLVPCGTWVLSREEREVYLEMAQARAEDGLRPDLLVASELSLRWDDIKENIGEFGGDWDGLIGEAQALKQLETIQAKLESEFANICPPEEEPPVPGDPMGDN